MSFPLRDYLPFDERRYTQEILPIWRQTLEGEIEPLKRLIQSASHFSLWPRLNYPLRCSKNTLEHAVSYSKKLVQVLDQWSEEERPNPWEMFQPFIEELEKAHRPGRASEEWQASDWPLILEMEKAEADSGESPLNILHACLFYTFCCDLSDQEKQKILARREEHWRPPVVMGNEDIPLWDEYSCRDEETRALWGSYYRRLFREQIDHTEEESSAQDLFQHLAYAPISAFLTLEEVQRLNIHLRRREAPFLQNIREGCIHDAAEMELAIDFSRVKTGSDVDINSGILTMDIYYQIWDRNETDEEKRRILRILYEELIKAHPDQMKQFEQYYYEKLWAMEAHIMQRVALAVSRGWGLVILED